MKPSPVSFQHRVLDPTFRSEGVAVADFNRDGKPDVAAGNVYFLGPDFKTCVPMLGQPKEFPQKGYSDAFLCFAADLDGDGWTDLVNVGFPGAATTWLKNPGAAGGEWRRFAAVEKTGNESPLWIDLDGDGRRELLHVSPQGVAAARPGDDPAHPWPLRVIAAPGDPRPGHGLGFGDVNGDGRPDVLVPQGWWEAPADRSQTPWPFHAAKLAEDCAQMCVADLDGDGDADVLSSSAHRYGVWWAEQTPDGWKLHEIEKTTSQTHALHMADFSGDGRLDFATGKRYWAHNGNDIGAAEPSLLLWFEAGVADGKPVWTRRVIDSDSGVGLHFAIADLDGDGLPDIATSNKKGVHVFFQRRAK
jgi:hypothetical protein